MNVKKIAPLIVALVLGGIAAKMAFNFVQKRQNGGLTEMKRPQVVVAKHGIDAGAVLTEDDLALGEVSPDAAMDNLFTATQQVAGRVTMVPVIQGQAITATLLAPRGVGPGLQAAVPIGMRAVTLEINEMTGVAGYLVPGCHVDVVQTLKDERTGLPVAHTLVQNVKVTAIGVRHNGSDGDGGGHSVTLLVTPAQAELLELASSVGRPRFALRGGNDLSMVASKGVTFAELIGHHAGDSEEYASAISPMAISPMPTTRPAIALSGSHVTTRPSNFDLDSGQWTVEIIRGGSASEVTFALHRSDAQLSDLPRQ
jgi:pilus assembly protein CpaB